MQEEEELGYTFRLKLEATMRPIITGHQPKHVAKFFNFHQ
jgi:hypothetical protein